MAFGLIPLLILGGIVALIVRAVGNRGDQESGGDAVRRFFQYSLLLTVVSIVANGLVGLIADLIPGDTLLREQSNATPLAFLIIGGPFLFLLGRWVATTLDEDERRSLGWALYLAATGLTALSIAGAGLFGVGEAIVGIRDFDANSSAMALVWGAVWFVHWRLSADNDHAHKLWVHLAGGSLAGLVTLAISTGGIITAAITTLYEAAFGVALLARGDDVVAQSIIGLVIGGAVFWRYWLSTYAGRARDMAWNAYVLLPGVLGGLVTVLSSAGGALFLILDWYFGGSADSASVHFEGLPALIAAALVGAGILLYHRAVFRAEGVGRTEPRRVYDYLVSAAGLLAAAFGVTVVLVAVIQSVLPTTTVAGASDRSTLMAAISALVVGAPVWWRMWSSIQRHRTANPTAELASQSRRLYIFVLFGVGGVTALVALLTLTITLLEDLFDGKFGADTIYDVRVSLALVITVGAVSAFHWAVRKEDQADAPAPEEVEHAVRLVVLVSAEGRAVADEVTRQTGVRVRVWDRHDTDVSATVEDVIAAIETGSHPRLMLIADSSGLTSVPYTERA